MNRITIAICTHNRYDLLPQAIDSALAQSIPCRVLVLDNTPDEKGARDFARAYGDVPDLAYRHLDEVGLANARNVAVEQCSTPFLAFMDDDAVAAPDWAEALAHAFDALGEDVGIVGGRVKPLWEAKRPEWLHEDLLVSLSLVDWGGELRIAGPSEWFAGTNIAFRMSALTRAKPFNVALGRKGDSVLMSNEEIEVVGSLQEAGWRSAYQPGAVVSHFIPVDRLSKQWFRQRYAWQAVSDATMDPFLLGSGREEDMKHIHREVVERLLQDTDDPETFRNQILWLHHLMRVALAKDPA
jgi:GT2 family glycosyltransferase